MQGEGAPVAPALPDSMHFVEPEDPGVESDGTAPEMWDDSVDPEAASLELDDEDVEEGVLVDEDDIGPGSVACQEH